MTTLHSQHVIDLVSKVAFFGNRVILINKLVLYYFILCCFFAFFIIITFLVYLFFGCVLLRARGVPRPAIVIVPLAVPCCGVPGLLRRDVSEV